MLRPFLLLATLLLSGVGLTLPARAGGNLPDKLVQAQLLPGWTTQQGTRMVALRLTLAPGWKTYWRAPGDAGIPPVIKWHGSQNLAAVRMHWPRPHVYDYKGVRTVGYKGELVLPIELTPTRAGAPIVLSADMELGICESVCVPATLRFGATLDGKGASDPAIKAALDDQPISARRAGVGRVACRFDPVSDGLRLTTDIRMPRMGGAEVALVETADPRVWVSEAEVRRKGNTLTVTVDLVPPRGKSLAVDRSGLRFTILGDRQAVDISGCVPG